jgi:hypothetical protein
VLSLPVLVALVLDSLSVAADVSIMRHFSKENVIGDINVLNIGYVALDHKPMVCELVQISFYLVLTLHCFCQGWSSSLKNHMAIAEVTLQHLKR